MAALPARPANPTPDTPVKHTAITRVSRQQPVPKTGSLSDMLDMLYRIGPRQPTAAPST